MGVQPSSIWRWACKDWRLFFADRQGALLCFAVPIILASLFGTIFHRSGAWEFNPRTPLWVVCEDDSSFSAQLVGVLLAEQRMEVMAAGREEAFAEQKRRGKGAVLVLPKDFGKRLLSQAGGKEPRPELELVAGGEDDLTRRWLEGVLTEIVLRKYVMQMLAKLGPMARVVGLNLPTEETLVQRPFEFRTQGPAGSPLASLDSYGHSFAGMTIQYLLFWGMDSGLLSLRERRRGIWNRLRASPLSLPSLLMGKTFSTMVIALLLIGMSFGFGFVVFGVGIRGSAWAFLVLALALAFLSATMGLLVASLASNECRARSVSILVILALSMLGGLWLPSFLLPDWVQNLSESLPTTWAMRGILGNVRGNLDLWRSLPHVGILLVFGMGFLLVSIWRFKWTECAAEG